MARAVFFLFLFFCHFGWGDVCRVKTRAEIQAGLPALDAYINQVMAETSVDGISLVVISEGELLFERQYGDGLSEPLFQAASISKPVAAFAALKLGEKGQLSLDDPMTRFVSKPYLPSQDFTELVTLRNILNHTSGMGEDPDGLDRKIYFKPGTEYRYSGAGYRYLQQAMEDMSAMDFESLMQPYLRSLGMNQSTFDLFYENEHWIASPYSLVTTPRELALFFDELAYPHPDNRAVAKLMVTPSVKLGEGYNRGLGVVLTGCGDDTSINHSGRNFGIHRSEAHVYMKSRAGAIVMTRGKDTAGLPQDIVKRAIGGY